MTIGRRRSASGLSTSERYVTTSQLAVEVAPDPTRSNDAKQRRSEQPDVAVPRTLPRNSQFWGVTSASAPPCARAQERRCEQTRRQVALAASEEALDSTLSNVSTCLPPRQDTAGSSPPASTLPESSRAAWAVPLAAAPKTAAAGSGAVSRWRACVELGEELVGVDRPEALAGGGTGVDERAQLGGILEEVVEAVEGGAPCWSSPPASRCQSARWPLMAMPRAGEVRERERLVAAGLPGVEREVEGGELEAARVELEAEEVVGDDRVGGLAPR